MDTVWVVQRAVAVDDVLIAEYWRTCIHTLGGRGVPCFCGSWSLLPSHVFLGEPLFPRFGFPVVITDSSTLLDHSAAELTEH